ncbi:MAG: cation diffusion facilitator family transporter [Hyphomicrobiaceae bacterium]
MVDVPESGSVERRYLLIATIANAAIGVLGVIFAYLAQSQAILLDGLFNLTYFVSGIFTIRVSRLLERDDDQEFPHGYAYFEPLVNGTKGLLVLGVTAMALLGAIEALLTGGSPIAAGPAMLYGSLAALTCWGVAIYMRDGAKRTGSPLIEADAQNWIVNAAISSTVLCAFMMVFLIQGTPMSYLAPYIDPTLVVVVATITICVPVRMAWQSLMELLGRAADTKTVAKVRSAIEAGTTDLPVKARSVRVVQPGRTRVVITEIVLPKDFRPDNLEQLDQIRDTTLQLLRRDHSSTYLGMIFTTRLGHKGPT